MSSVADMRATASADRPKIDAGLASIQKIETERSIVERCLASSEAVGCKP